ncbi:Atu4866 domain-containing protein [Kineococcus arenarius]|uniref:Atu4866 domain-containing protein n=1 Tax=Kineococcus sp. SYSU DK007 TaxID=3383128 RepID=UPI003D7D7C55
MPNTFPTFTAAGLAAVRAGADRPLLLTNATVHTLDPLIGTMPGADVLIGGALIVGVGPGIVTAAEDDGAVVIDATGTTVLPACLDATVTLGTAARGTGSGTLAPGADAGVIVVPDEHAPDLATALHTAFTQPELLLAVLQQGRPVHWAGRLLTGAATAPLQPDRLAVDPGRVGVWIDTDDFLHQDLTADGRYDETRGGRPHAFTGRYWIDGERIDYLDDLGFWAFGRFSHDGTDDALHHAGYTMHRKDAR